MAGKKFYDYLKLDIADPENGVTFRATLSCSDEARVIAAHNTLESDQGSLRELTFELASAVGGIADFLSDRAPVMGVALKRPKPLRLGIELDPPSDDDEDSEDEDRGKRTPPKRPPKPEAPEPSDKPDKPEEPVTT